MVRILFVCLGNICRSPMAEFLFLELARRAGLEDGFEVASAATSDEAVGCPIHTGAKRKLQQMGIPYAYRQARRITKADYARFDYIIGMEKRNVSAMRVAFSGDPAGKLHRLLDFTDRPRDIADPWYTGDFDTAYDELLEGCTALLERLKGES